MIKLVVFDMAGTTVSDDEYVGKAFQDAFAKNGYSVALVARGSQVVNSIAEEINSSGGEASPFPVPSYSHEDITSIWSAIQTRFPKPEFAIRAAVFNAGEPVFKGFLEITPDEIQSSLQVGAAAFSFSRGAILAFKGNGIEETNGKRGTLIFTGATASLRGGPLTSAFSVGKHGVRALSQSLAKEFGKENIHVAHSIIDGGILTAFSRQYKSEDWAQNEDLHLRPDSIASAYWYLTQQDRSAWTWELDLRPAHEKW